ncbi:MAG: hypothetical protein Kow0098_09500 [Ignavibacteriaceae bacterium]
MKKFVFPFLITAATVFLTSSVIRAQEFNPVFSSGLQIGYYDGFSFSGTGSVSGFAENFPLVVRFGIGYNFPDAGSPELTRKVFINDASNGTPESSASTWDFRLDLLYSTDLLGMKNTFIYFGPRFAVYNAHFEFIGGNEFYDIGSENFGLGGGIESHFRMTRNISLIISGGADYYFNSMIGGHDTFYSPDGNHINPREGYDYQDADESVSQPKIEFRLMTGINYYF